jgi:hypothetical protein
LQDDVDCLIIPCCHLEEVGTPCPVGDCPGCLTTECKWALFVQMATWRFGIWLDKLVAQGNPSIPPLDVLLIWSTYLGSPDR